MNTLTITPQQIQTEIQTLFTSYHPQSRVWIYQSNREMNHDEAQSITRELKNFCQSWTAHQVALRADALVLYNYFIVLIVDEAVSGASGCSIDKSVKQIQQLELKYQLELMNRLRIALYQNESIQLMNLNDVKRQKEVLSDTYFFDNSITTLHDLHIRWFRPVKGSYLALN